MTAPITLECEVEIQRARTKVDGATPSPAPIAAGRVLRVARLMALALKLDRLVGDGDGAIDDFAQVARLAHVTRARISQIMSLVNLAPDIQEQVLFLPAIERGKDPIILRELLPIARTVDWRRQRRQWTALAARCRRSS
jgi:hypothetical protein